MPGDGVNASGNCALPVEQLVVPLSVCVSVANGNLCMHHAKINERNQCQSRFRSPICDYIIRRQMSSLAFLGEQRRCRRDAGACIINNEMIWTLTLAKSLSQVRNGVEVETRESQRVAAAKARLTQLFQLSDCCCCCCCFCCIYCRMVGLMSVCPFVCLSVCLSGLVLRLSWSPLMIYAGARLPLPAWLAGCLREAPAKINHKTLCVCAINIAD